MKEIIEYHKPFTGKLQHICFKLTKKEATKLRKEYGEPKRIIREYLNLQPMAVRLTGYGWVMKKDGYVKEVVYFEPTSLKYEYIDNVKIHRV